MHGRSERNHVIVIVTVTASATVIVAAVVVVVVPRNEVSVNCTPA